MLFTRRTLTLAAALIGALTLSALAQTQDLSPAQQAHSWAAQNADIAVTAKLDRPSAAYEIGEKIRLRVGVSKNAYVTVLNIGPTGNVTVLFPNVYAPDNLLMGGQQVDVPSSGASITAQAPAGTELIKVIATNRPLALNEYARFADAGGFQQTQDGAGLARDLRLEAQSDDAARLVLGQTMLTLTTTEAAAGAGNSAEPQVKIEPQTPTVPENQQSGTVVNVCNGMFCGLENFFAWFAEQDDNRKIIIAGFAAFLGVIIIVILAYVKSLFRAASGDKS